MMDDDEKAATNRGSRPGKGVGEVTGSGAGAGGGGNPEDPDRDPIGGGGAIAPTTPGTADGEDDIPRSDEGSPAG